jgi:isoamylase
MEVWPGRPYPLGATYDGLGTNFSIFSEVADRVELCLFDRSGAETRVDLPEMSGFNWHGYLPGVKLGDRYGFRVHGPWAPRQGLRCNANKLLLDPYSKAVEGQVRWDGAVFGYNPDRPDEMDTRDSAPFVPRSVVTQSFFDWEHDRPPATPWHRTTVYEMHVKGFTKRFKEIPENLRGTYAGLAHPAAIDYLQSLGVTAVELMPVHQFVHERFLADKGLRNYWGYASIAYLAPHNEYAADRTPGRQVEEFKYMVRSLHAAGIEVLLDVVYNHTAEGNNLGPMLCYKGIDNRAYYRVAHDDPRLYVDYTGTGNSLNMRHPRVLQLIMDSLRYWVLEMHVDGFRFDLASALARELHDVDRLSAFFDLIQQDPIISQVKLIAEPWDVGEGGYQVGNFPPLWSEWNGKYRDCVRDYWRGEHRTLAELASRFTGSSDLYEETGRRPYASINFVTCHDGFTLRDLVSYNEKHNEANLEENRDGESHNRSWNCGAEGPTDDPEIIALRARQQRNFLATLFLSQGVPMLLSGDEFGRSQGGNNNAYCHDNEISWLDWDNIDTELLRFTRDLIGFVNAHPTFHRRHWFQGRQIHGSGVRDIHWLRPDGKEMTAQDWDKGFAKSLAVFLNGREIPSPGRRGERIVDDTFLILLNAHDGPLDFTIPPKEWGRRWRITFDTASGYFGPREGAGRYAAGEQVGAMGRSLVLLQELPSVS